MEITKTIVSTKNNKPKKEYSARKRVNAKDILNLVNINFPKRTNMELSQMSKLAAKRIWINACTLISNIKQKKNHGIKIK
jgi:hypothetical protein